MANKKKINDEQELPKLTPFEERFIGVYFNVGFIAAKAYKLLKPHVTDESARAEASKILTKLNVKHEIELRKMKIKNEEEIQLGFLVHELKSIIYELKPFPAVEYDTDGKVINKKDYKAVLGAVAQLSKLAGLDNHTQKIEIENTNEKPQEITININKSKK